MLLLSYYYQLLIHHFCYKVDNRLKQIIDSHNDSIVVGQTYHITLTATVLTPF